jgi:signal transduction histidine kinase
VQDAQQPGAEASAAQVEHFMSVAAHDLRNPIAVVRASAQMAQRQLNRGDLDAARGRLAAIVEQTDRLSDMLETFLDAARLGAERLPRRDEHVDLHDIVVTAVDRARRFAGEHAQRAVELEVPEGCVGVWDGVHLERAVRALIANALLYGDPQAPVRITGSQVGQGVQVTVSGGGAGPDEEEASHLFEPFFRGRSAAEAGQSGSGLGLYTARGIARLHGGDVRYLGGDRFQLDVPLG